MRVRRRIGWALWMLSVIAFWFVRSLSILLTTYYIMFGRQKRRRCFDRSILGQTMFVAAYSCPNNKTKYLRQCSSTYIFDAAFLLSRGMHNRKRADVTVDGFKEYGKLVILRKCYSSLNSKVSLESGWLRLDFYTPRTLHARKLSLPISESRSTSIPTGTITRHLPILTFGSRSTFVTVYATTNHGL
jgi:hypothetical protein